MTASGSGASSTERRGGVPITRFLIKSFPSSTKTRFDEHSPGPQTNKYNATTIQQMAAVGHSAQSHRVRISGVTTMLDTGGAIAMLQHLYSSCFRYGSNRQIRRLVLVEDNISAPTEQESLQATLEARLTIRVANGRSVTRKTSKAFTLLASHSLTTFAPRVVYDMTPIEPSAQIPHATDLGDSRTKTTSTKTRAANTQ
jgi:hypothetical protein